MKLTKYEHACLDVTEGDSRLIIDPGIFTTSLTDFTSVTAVVVTHVHGDHFDKEKVLAIVAANPAVQLFTTGEVTEQLQIPEARVPKTGQTYTAGAFQLEFYGELHAVISPDVPVAQNIGVLVNDALYYPGDSCADCPKPYKLLAIPFTAPWVKFSDSLELIKSTPATMLIPTHDGLVNQAGQTISDNWFAPACEKLGKTYRHLAPGESIEV